MSIWLFPLLISFFSFYSFQKPVFQELLRDAFPNCEISEERRAMLRNLLTGILRIEPSDRPTAENVLRHPLLSRDGVGQLLEEDRMWPTSPQNVSSKVVLNESVKSPENKVSSSDEILCMERRKVTLEEFLENMKEIIEGPDYVPSLEMVKQASPPPPRIEKRKPCLWDRIRSSIRKNCSNLRKLCTNCCCASGERWWGHVQERTACCKWIDPMSFMLSNPICEASFDGEMGQLFNNAQKIKTKFTRTVMHLFII